jgi:hypothetical protein
MEQQRQEAAGHVAAVQGSRAALSVGRHILTLDFGAASAEQPALCVRREAHTAAITALAFSASGALLASTGEDKAVHVWDGGGGGSGVAPLHSRVLPKKPSCAAVGSLPPAAAVAEGAGAAAGAADEEVLLVGDKTGELMALSLPDVSEGGGKSRFLLAHTGSILTAVALSRGRGVNGRTGAHVLTADRDEKVRVSRFPKAYEISAFCLGHTEYVSAVALHPPATADAEASEASEAAAADDAAAKAARRRVGATVGDAAFAEDDELVFSGGGDGFVRLFHFPTGALRCSLQLPGGGGGGEDAEEAALAAGAGGGGGGVVVTALAAHRVGGGVVVLVCTAPAEGGGGGGDDDGAAGAAAAGAVHVLRLRDGAGGDAALEHVQRIDMPAAGATGAAGVVAPPSAVAFLPGREAAEGAVAVVLRPGASELLLLLQAAAAGKGAAAAAPLFAPVAPAAVAALAGGALLVAANAAVAELAASDRSAAVAAAAAGGGGGKGGPKAVYNGPGHGQFRKQAIEHNAPLHKPYNPEKKKPSGKGAAKRRKKQAADAARAAKAEGADGAEGGAELAAGAGGGGGGNEAAAASRKKPKTAGATETEGAAGAATQED